MTQERQARAPREHNAVINHGISFIWRANTLKGVINWGSTGWNCKYRNPSTARLHLSSKLVGERAGRQSEEQKELMRILIEEERRYSASTR